LGAEAFRFPVVGLGVPPCWRAYFLLLRQKKVAKEKATPRSAPLRGSLRYSASRAAAELGLRPQTVLADCPRPACVAQRLSWGPERRPWATGVPKKMDCYGQPQKKPKNEICRSFVDALPGPFEGAEQRRVWRKRGEDCLRAQPEFRSPRQSRVAQGTRAAGTDPGSPFLCLLSFGEAKESETPLKGGTPSLKKPPCKEQRAC